MKTFDITVEVDARLTVTDTFVVNLRKAAVDHPEDLTWKTDPFLAKMQEMYPEDDEEFVKAVLANGLRKMTRLSVVEKLEGAGVAATVAPATIEWRAIAAVDEAIAAKLTAQEEAHNEAVAIATAATVSPHTDEEIAALVGDADTSGVVSTAEALAQLSGAPVGDAAVAAALATPLPELPSAPVEGGDVVAQTVPAPTQDDIGTPTN